MSDAAHMFSDFASFLVSLFAIHLGSKKSTRKFTYGLYRAEVLGALITVMIIWFVIESFGSGRKINSRTLDLVGK